MISDSNVFPGVEYKCSCFPDDHSCLCSKEEPIIRGYSLGTITAPMTPEQRQWCIDQVLWADEGQREEELTPLGDKELAYKTIRAWLDYANSMY